jgi:hypothetical protein
LKRIPCNVPMRHQVRFKIAAACRFWWSEPSGEINFASGRTRDLSSGEVCVIAQVCPRPGAVVMLEIDLRRPDDCGHLHNDILLRAEGTVVRQNRDQGEFEVLITFAELDHAELFDEIKELEGNSDASR